MARLWASGEKKDDIVKLSHEAVGLLNSLEALGRVWPHVVKESRAVVIWTWLWLLAASL